MKTVRYLGTLFYYDGPQVIEARDAIGGHYIGTLLAPETEADEPRWLIAGVTPERLREFRTGALDLRALLVERPESDWYLADAASSLQAPFELLAGAGALVDTDLLPESGFLLHASVTASVAVQEARARGNLVAEICVEPPESAQGHRIRANTLAGLLNHWQTVVRHAYAVALRETDKATRNAAAVIDAHLFDVVIAAAPGSFKIVLEAAAPPDLLGESDLARALRIVDELFAHPEDAEETLRRLKERRGHLASAYLRTLGFLVEHRTSLRYTWAQPTSKREVSRGVSQSESQALVARLAGVSNLGAENVSLVGRFTVMNLERGNWGLETEEGLRTGMVRKGGPSLTGLISGGLYRFDCIEETSAVDGSGKERRKLYLEEYAQL